MRINILLACLAILCGTWSSSVAGEEQYPKDESKTNLFTQSENEGKISSTDEARSRRSSPTSGPNDGSAEKDLSASDMSNARRYNPSILSNTVGGGPVNSVNLLQDNSRFGSPDYGNAYGNGYSAPYPVYGSPYEYPTRTPLYTNPQPAAPSLPSLFLNGNQGSGSASAINNDISIAYNHYPTDQLPDYQPSQPGSLFPPTDFLPYPPAQPLPPFCTAWPSPPSWPLPPAQPAPPAQQPNWPFPVPPPTDWPTATPRPNVIVIPSPRPNYPICNQGYTCPPLYPAPNYLPMQRKPKVYVATDSYIGRDGETNSKTLTILARKFLKPTATESPSNYRLHGNSYNLYEPSEDEGSPTSSRKLVRMVAAKSYE